MIQGLQVRRSENAGVILEELLHLGAGPGTEVLSCGLSGTDPAHYLELCRYAAERFRPAEMILCVFIGNDFAHVHRNPGDGVDKRDPQIYYFIDAGGELTLHPGSEPARRTLHRTLSYNHRSLLLNVYRTARSHYLTRRVLLQTAGALLRGGERTPPPKGNRIAAGLRAIGLDDFIFRKELDAEGAASIDVVTGLLERANRFAASHGIALRIVTIPVFPAFFFEQYRGGNWSLETDEYDFLNPETALSGFAARHGITILALGGHMRETGVRADRIEELFFNGGSGHFTPAGHRYLAGAIYAAFYGRDTGYAAGAIAPWRRSFPERHHAATEVPHRGADR
jgi:hypothetical protein